MKKFTPRSPTAASAPHRGAWGRARGASSASGFSLIELMIALAIVAILAAVAYPSFQDAVRKSRRADAFDAISRIQLAQERWRSNAATYAASIIDAPDETPPGLGLSAGSSDGHYTLALSPTPTATSYTLIATAQGGQAQDVGCKFIGVRVTAGNLDYGGGATEVEWADPNRCWAK